MSAAATQNQAVYGPVPSRRLGRSLGVDLVPLKTCTYDCIYCQLGRTTDKTVRRQRWADPAAIVAEVAARLHTRPDIITIAGSGEPTLDTGIGEVIEGIRRIAQIPVAVLTNSSLLGSPAVRRDLAEADIVIPSLDASDEETFARVNRPHRTLRFADVVAGMATFREEYRGEIWLEVLLLDGITATAAHTARLVDIAARLAPDRIQLNTAVRPPAEASARPVASARFEELARLFTPRAEVIVPTVSTEEAGATSRENVSALIARRPCTLEDIAAGLAIHRNEALKAVSALVDAGSAVTFVHGEQLFYAAAAVAAQHPTKETP